MVAALVWLPAVLRLRDLRRLKREADPDPVAVLLPLPARPAVTPAKAKAA
jgi:hypothetical protein